MTLCPYRYDIEGMVNGRPMPEDDLAARIARHRETAETLRGIAEQLRFDPRRSNQLRALADGFERFAMRLEGEQTWRAQCR